MRSSWHRALALLLLAACRQAPAPPAIAPLSTEIPVSFSSDPAGAMLELDGAALANHRTPFTLILPAGSSHRARFLLYGFEPAERAFLVPTRPYPVAAPLSPAARVPVTSEPPGAAVDLDGQPALAATPGEVAVAQGEHLLTARLRGYASVRLHLAADQRGPLHFRLAREAFLAIASAPSGAAIVLDGVDTGLTTPVDHLSVASGTPHGVVLKQQKLASDPIHLRPLKPGEVRRVAGQLHDQDFDRLNREVHHVREELARWQVEQHRYQRANDQFIIGDARKAQANAEHLKEADEHVEELSTDLAGLVESLQDLGR